MSKVISKINGSGLYAQSAASAATATYDKNGKDIASTYMSAGKLSLNSDGKITAYNGSAFVGEGGSVTLTSQKGTILIDNNNIEGTKFALSKESGYVHDYIEKNDEGEYNSIAFTIPQNYGHYSDGFSFAVSEAIREVDLDVYWNNVWKYTLTQWVSQETEKEFKFNFSTCNITEDLYNSGGVISFKPVGEPKYNSVKINIYGEKIKKIELEEKLDFQYNDKNEISGINNSAIAVGNVSGEYVPLSGGIISGDITLSSNSVLHQVDITTSGIRNCSLTSVYDTVESWSGSWGEGGGKKYTGISPITVNNTGNTISFEGEETELGEGLGIVNKKLTVTAQGGKEYTAGANINITNNVISGKDWSSDLNNKIDSSALIYETIYSENDYIAGISGKDFKAAFANNSNTAFWVESEKESVDPINFEYITAGIEKVDNKLDSSAINFNTQGTVVTGISGKWLSAVSSTNAEVTKYIQDSEGYLEDWSALVHAGELEYNSDGQISGYAGSAFATGSEGKTYEGISPIVVNNDENKISANCAEVDFQQFTHDDSLVHTSNNTQYALGVNIDVVKKALGIDETLLWSGDADNEVTTITLSENVSNFERLKIYFNNNDGYFKYVEVDTKDLKTILDASFIHNTNTAYYVKTRQVSFSDTKMTLSTAKQYKFLASEKTMSYSEMNSIHVIKVIGIGRKN